HGLKELLDLASWLIGIDYLGWDAPPRVLYVAWNEHGFASSEAESLLADLQFHLAVHNVKPFVLVPVDVARPAGVVHLQNTQCAASVLSRHLAINRRAVAVKPIIEPVFSCADAEAHKQFLTLHLLCSFQVADRFIDGFNQRAGSGDVLFENL